MKRRRLGAVAALTAGGFGHAHPPACLAFTLPGSPTPPSVGIPQHGAAIHPVSLDPSPFKSCKRTHENNRSPNTKIPGTSGTSATTLSAFWARGTDTPPADERRRDGNSFLRRILPRDSTSSNSESVSFSRSADGPEGENRKRTTGRPRRSSSSQSSSAKASPTARYYYVSPATLHERCPQWTPGAGPIDLAEECPLDDIDNDSSSALFVGASVPDELSERLQLQARAPHVARASAATPNVPVGLAVDEPGTGEDEEAAAAVPPPRSEEPRAQQKEKAASRLVEEALDGFIHRHALHTVSPSQVTVVSSVQLKGYLFIIITSICVGSIVHSPSHHFTLCTPTSFLKNKTQMNLKIKSDATSRSAVLLRGELGSVRATFDRLSFASLKLSGGGTITATDLNLNTASFVPALGRFVRRWSHPFTLRATDCVLTQEDLRTSRCIRRGLTNLGNRILRNLAAMGDASPLDVVRIDRGARLSVSTVEVVDGAADGAQVQIRGIVTTILGSTIPFAVRTGLAVARGGHVVQFPGLRVVLNPGPLQTVVPLHLLHKVELDLGDRASIGKVQIDGRRKQIRLSATVSVTPRGIAAASPRRRGAAVGGAAAAIVKRATYAFDIGRWLTSLSFTN